MLAEQLHFLRNFLFFILSTVHCPLSTTGLNTLTVPGCKSSMLDIAPDWAGIIFGVSNTLSNVPGFVAPTVVGLHIDYTVECLQKHHM